MTQTEGGTVETYATLASGVEVLMTLHHAVRSRNYGTDAVRTDITVTGVDARLDRSDVRLLVTSSESLSELVGWYLRIESAQEHPAGLGGLQVARVTCKCSKLELPDVFVTTAPMGP